MATDRRGEEISPEFWENVDKFVALANELSHTFPIARVSASLLYAAARYNAFNAIVSDKEIGENREKAIDYFCEQYRKMLAENLDEQWARQKRETPT